MKLGFWGWFGIIMGILGAGIGIFASINPMAVGNIFLQIGPEKIGTYMTIGMPILFIVIFGAVLGPLAMNALKNSQKKKRLLKVGQKASVKILNVHDTGVTINMNPYVKITVQMPNGNNATFEMLVSRIQIPSEGDMIDVLYDPSDPTVVMAA